MNSGRMRRRRGSGSSCCVLKDRKPLGITIIAKDFVATDMTYCQMAAKEIPIKLRIHNVETTEILTAVEETIKIYG